MPLVSLSWFTYALKRVQTDGGTETTADLWTEI